MKLTGASTQLAKLLLQLLKLLFMTVLLRTLRLPQFFILGQFLLQHFALFTQLFAKRSLGIRKFLTQGRTDLGNFASQRFPGLGKLLLELGQRLRFLSR
ncbi:hypothetical protein D3C81_1736290 [compost metagenome]